MHLLFLITLALWAIPQCSFEAVALQQQLLASADSQMLASLLVAAELAGGNRYDGGDEAAADLPQCNIGSSTTHRKNENNLLVLYTHN